MNGRRKVAALIIACSVSLAGVVLYSYLYSTKPPFEFLAKHNAHLQRKQPKMGRWWNVPARYAEVSSDCRKELLGQGYTVALDYKIGATYIGPSQDSVALFDNGDGTTLVHLYTYADRRKMTPPR